jgi:putative transposase
MPARLERRQQTGDFHFLTTSCHGRLPYLRSAKAASIFEHALERHRSKYQFDVLGYVVMPEHVHMLISESRTHPLSTIIGALKRSVSKQLPESPFWLDRYFDRNIFSEDERIEKLRYIHRNPVVRKLCGHPSENPWSSFNAYARGEQGVVRIETDLRCSR